MSDPTQGRPARILLSAYACVPERGSEPGVGWNWFIRLAKRYEVWLLTEEYESARAVRPYLSEHYPELVDRVHVVGVPRRRFGEGVWKHLFYYLTYRQWQRDAYATAARLHGARPFDLVHHLNMIGFREPGYLWQLDAPFVLGPISGAANFPWRFIKLLPLRDRLSVTIKNSLNFMQLALSRRVRRAIHQAKVVMVANTDNQKLFERWCGIHGVVMNETGSAPVAADVGQEINSTVPLRLVWCGGFVPRKLLNMALLVVARVARETAVTLDIVGTGPHAEKIQSYAQALGIQGQCRWHGQLPHGEAKKKMAEADVLLFTSLVEGTPHVVLEALSLGRPVLCHAISGQGDVVTEDCGVKVAVEDPDTSVDRFANAIAALAADRGELARLKRGALERAEALSWDRLVDRAGAIYDSVLDGCTGDHG